MPETKSETAKDLFYEPLRSAVAANPGAWNTLEYTDLDHALCGAGRVLEDVSSGRDWLQRAACEMGLQVKHSQLFDSLKSQRRTDSLAATADGVAELAKLSASDGHDALAAHGDLDGFAVYATDGHMTAPSAHEDPIMGRVKPRANIFSLDLRRHSLHHIELCSPRPGKKYEHEITTMKRVDPKSLRMGQPKGTKVIHCYDPAIVDYRQWRSWKHVNGVYIVTRECKASALALQRQRQWDRSDPRNNGVLGDEDVLFGKDCRMRRVTYEDPVTLKVYRFLSNELTLAPGLIAFLYKMRWDIEKAFDQSKNRFGERKAWGKSEQAKRQQALFVTIAHNLSLIFERRIEREQGIVDEISIRKRQKRMQEQILKAKANRRPFNSLVESCRRITQRSFRFIRWIRYCLRSGVPWAAALEKLRPIMAQ